MGLTEKIRGLFRREAKTGTTYSVLGARSGGHPLWDAPVGRAEQVATVYRCVKLLSESVANLPLVFKRYRNGIYEPDTARALNYLLNVQPDGCCNAFDFWRQAVQTLLLRGNAYIVPQYDAAEMDIYRLVLCAPSTVTHNTLADTYYITDPWNGVFGTFSEDEVIHLRGLSGDDPKHGLSVVEYARRAINIAATGDAETLDRFANGGNVRGIISNNTTTAGYGEYQDDQLASLARMMDKGFRAGDRIGTLPGDTRFTQLSLSSTDMQFLESRKFTVREICRFFGVHPSFVFDDTSNNYKSAEMANVAFLSTTLNPMLRSIEVEFLRKLVPANRTAKYKFEFDRRALYACDLDSRVRYQQATIAAGIYSVNDWRREENRPAVEGGDEVFVSTNLRPLSELTKPKFNEQ